MINYDKKCKDTIGGIKRLFLMEYVFYDETEIWSNEMQLTKFPATMIYQFDCNGSYTQDSQFNNGNVSFNHVVNVDLPKVYNVIDAHEFTDRDYRVICETNNGEYILFGTNNGLVCSLSNSSGQGKSEFNGFNLTFTGLEEKTGLYVAELSDYFTIFSGESNLFNYYFNFDL